MQLLVHLLHNAGEVIYLRAPAGAGKTRFAERLQSAFDDEAEVVLTSALVTDRLPQSVAEELGMSADAAQQWPNGILAAIGGRELVLIVDDADQLDLASLHRLAAMHAAGGRLLLVGQGRLADTQGDWDVQFVDLPPFDATQSATFLRRNAGDLAPKIRDEQLSAAFSVTGGLPGPLLDILDSLTAAEDGRMRPPAGARRGLGMPWQWPAIALAVVVLGSILVFQDEINEQIGEDGSKAPVHPAEVLTPEPVAGATVEPPVDTGPAADRPATGQPAMPEIALPELRPEPVVVDPAARHQERDAAVTSPVPPAADSMDREEPADPPDATAATPDSVVEVDPLDRIMQDMLEAAPPASPDPMPEPESSEQASSQPASSEQALPAVAVSTPADSGSPDGPGGVAAVPAGRPVDQGVAEAEGPAVVAQQAPGAGETAPRHEPGAAAEPAKAPVAAVAEGEAAPVEERPAAPAEKAGRPVRQAVEVAPPAPPAEPAEVTGGGSAWLQGRNPRHFTLQLLGAHDRAAVERFARERDVPMPHAIFVRTLKGKPWYSLVVGDYPSRAAAIAGRDRLPASAGGDKAWPRTFDSIHKAK